MIWNFTTLFPLFASLTAHLTITTFNFTSWGTTSQQIHGQVQGGHKRCQTHVYPKAKDASAASLSCQKMPRRHLLTAACLSFYNV